MRNQFHKMYIIIIHNEYNNDKLKFHVQYKKVKRTIMKQNIMSYLLGNVTINAVICCETTAHNEFWKIYG